MGAVVRLDGIAYGALTSSAASDDGVVLTDPAAAASALSSKIAQVTVHRNSMEK